MASPYRCPQCKKRFDERGSAFPFCSEKCRLLDLSSWMSGEYCITRPLTADDDGADDAGVARDHDGLEENGNGNRRNGEDHHDDALA